jgi:dTDP-4-amino-4,6-dideoxygalactose transaminase
VKVPYVDLIAQHAPLRDELLEAMGAVLDHGWFILGPEVKQLEQQLAQRLGVSAVVGVNSGTDALLLGLRLAGIGPGDEVITVSHSFVATASTIKLVGATPVFCDIDDDSMLMDPAQLAGLLTPRTRAVMPVHLGGFTADMTAISAFCAEHGLALIEDAAQSIGSLHRGRCGGSFGIGCFSLHPLKVLSAAGDAGFVAVNDPEQETRLRQWRNLGLADRDHVRWVSGNSRLDTLQAALLLVKLRHLDRYIDARRAHAAAYREAFAGKVRCPPPEVDERSVYSTFVIRHPRRDALLAAIRAHGVDAKVHYPIAIHQQQALADVAHGPLPVTERVVDEIISLPVTPEVDEAGRALVIRAVLSALDEVGQ